MGCNLLPSYRISSLTSEGLLEPGLSMISNETGWPGSFCKGFDDVVEGDMYRVVDAAARERVS